MKRVTIRGWIARATLFGAMSFFAATPSLIHAQPASGSTGAQAQLEQLKAKIEAVKYARIKTELGLDDQSAQKFFEIYRPAEKDIQAIVKQRNEELRKLGQLMKGAKSDSDVDPEMDKIRDYNKQIESRTVELDQELKPVLSPRQRAKLLVFEHEFNTQVREEVVKRRIQNDQNKALREKVKELRKQAREDKIREKIEKHAGGGGNNGKAKGHR